MRLIGHFENEVIATRASGLLGSNGIQNMVEPDEGRRWALWVHAEEDLERARQLLAGFLKAPDDPRYGTPARPPAENISGPPNPRERDESVSKVREFGVGATTVAVVIICGAVAFVTSLTAHHPLVARFQMAEVGYRLGAPWDLFLPEVRSGQVWRLFTPALLHFGWPHLLFNLWTFWDLGNAIERRRGTLKLAGLILGLGVVSNLGQYLVSGPHFGGMSGVIYGLLGYVWMLGRYRPTAGLVLHPQIVLMMLVWFGICVSGALGIPVANTAHGVGLVAGMAWGRWVAWRGD